MTTAPTRVTSTLPVERPTMLPMPDPLWSNYCAIMNGAEYQPAYSELIHAQVRREFDMLAPLLTPVTDRQLRLWLAPIPLAVHGGAKTEEQIIGWLAAVSLACAGMPASVFNRASQAEALRTFKFFPSAADIYDLLSADRSRLAQRATILRRILQLPTEGT